MMPCPPCRSTAGLLAAPSMPPTIRVGWLLVPPLLTTLMCLGHALYCYALLTGLLPEQSLAGLAHVPGAAVAREMRLQGLQVLVVGGSLGVFTACWAFLQLRNQAVLRECRREALARPWPVYRRLPALLASLRPGPGSLPGDRPGRWLLPAWWGLLLAAAGCAAMGLLRLQVPGLTVGEWRAADYWLLAAHALFLGFFLLSQRLVRHLEALQRAYWQYRDAARGVRARPAGMAFKPSAG